MKIILNPTGNTITIRDVGDVSIGAGGSYTIPPQDFDLWAASVNAAAHVAAATLVVNDGYDNLKPEFGLRHLQQEGIPRPSAFIATESVLATANSTLALNATSRLVYVFTGSTSGQQIRLPNATTLNIGHRYEFWNISTVPIIIQDGAPSNQFILAVAQKTWALLQDNSTAAGIWLFEANYMGGSGGGNGCLNFGYQGTANSGRWLEVISNNPTDYTTGTPFRIAGSKAIRSLSLSGSINISATATVTLYKNNVNTIIDTISLVKQNSASKLNLNHILVDGDLLAARVTAGTISRPNITIWL